MLAGAAGSLRADPILLRPASTVYAGGAVLSPGIQSVPCVTDWNGDGRKDLIVGYRYADKLAVYLNSGTDAQPVFTTFANLQAGGVDIQHPASGCGAPAPWVCDYDGDGRRDLLVGTGAEGYVYFYRNTNTDAQPVLAPGVKLLAGGTTLTVSYRATPYVHDWDEDGQRDLLCGCGDGYVYLYRNVGAEQPVYDNGVRLQAGGVDLNVGVRSVVRVFDWDGDGIKDLVCSASDIACWCKNTGSNRSPVLAAPVRLKVATAAGLTPIDTSYRMRLDLVDWNNDGVMDLLIGDSNGPLYLYQGYRLAFSTITPQADKTLLLQWQSAPYLKYHVLAGPAPDQMQDQVATGLASGGNTTTWTAPANAERMFYRVLQAQ